MTHQFGADVLSALPELRAMAESRMMTAVAIEYITGKTVDPTTDGDVPVYTVAFSTKARFVSRHVSPRRNEAGGRIAVEVERELHIPWNSSDPWADARSAKGVFARVTAIDPTDDPSLAGIRVKLTGPTIGSQQTARRLEIVEVVA